MAAVTAATYAAAMGSVVVKAGEKRAPRRQQSWDTLAPPPAPSKCPACGSHEYQQHRGRQVCAYCRTAAP